MNKHKLVTQKVSSDVKQSQDVDYPSAKENNAIKIDNRRIVDLLDIQLLIAVIVLFVSAWAYLNSIICDFTTTEPYNERMSYILVHYILTSVLILCVSITYVKGKYLLKTDTKNFSPRERRYIDLFIYGWIWVLLLCVAILAFNSFTWIWGGLVFLIGLIYYMTIKQNFGWAETVVVNLLLVLCFPVFISTMVNISKDIIIKTSIDPQSDNISITIDPKSYDAKYYVVGLANKDLVKGEQYQVDKNVITTKSAFLRENQITVSTLSPAAGWENFFTYSLRKIFNKWEGADPVSTYNKTIIVNIDSNSNEKD